MVKKIVLCVLASLFLSACNEKEESYTVDDFMKNDSLRAEWVKKCENGELRPEELNCINALKAKNKKRSHNKDFFTNFGK